MRNPIDPSTTIYQSGQVVSVSGLYEVIGRREQPQLPTRFETDQIFAYCDGWEVCWHLVLEEQSDQNLVNVLQSKHLP